MSRHARARAGARNRAPHEPARHTNSHACPRACAKMVKKWSNIGQPAVHRPGSTSLRGPEKWSNSGQQSGHMLVKVVKSGEILGKKWSKAVKYCAKSGPMLVKKRSSAGIQVVKYWSTSGHILVEKWSNIGQRLCARQVQRVRARRVERLRHRCGDNTRCTTSLCTQVRYILYYMRISVFVDL